jgi:hypothetical protein
MLIDRSGYLSDNQNIKHVRMIQSVIENEIKSIKIGVKKQYAPNQIIQLYKVLYNELVYNIELEEQF